MNVCLIVAVAKSNMGIGKNNDLLWHLPADMKLFKETTLGFPVVTGRKNFESIPEKFRPLPNRENVVVTRNKNYSYKNTHISHSLEEGIALAKSFGKEKVFVIGGGQIYKEALSKDLITDLHITWVEGDFEADTFFPEFENSKWKIIKEIRSEVNEKNKFAFTYNHYQKI